jgi:tetratricopeptide (TPR) repeat protein
MLISNSIATDARPCRRHFGGRLKLVASVFAVFTFALNACAQGLKEIEQSVANGTCDKKTLESLSAMVDKDTGNAHLRFLLGEALARQGFQDLALEQFKLADSKDNYFLSEFKRRLLATDVPAATNLIFFARTLHPSDPSVLYLDGVLAGQKGETKKAHDLLTQAAGSSRPWPGTHAALSELAHMRGDFTECLREANLELAANPSNFEARSMKAQVRYTDGMPPKMMLGELKAIFAHDPTDQAVSFLLARALLDSGDYRGAVPAAIACLSAPGSQRLARAAEDILGEVENKLSSSEFNSLLEKNVAAMPDQFRRTFCRIRLSDFFEQQGNHSEAAKQLAACTVSGPGYFAAGVNLKLGRVFEKTHDDDQALFYYRLAHRQSPQDHGIDGAFNGFKRRMDNRSNDLSFKLKKMLSPNSLMQKRATSPSRSGQAKQIQPSENKPGDSAPGKAAPLRPAG